jgi:hypothetical protein
MEFGDSYGSNTFTLIRHIYIYSTAGNELFKLCVYTLHYVSLAIYAKNKKVCKYLERKPAVLLVGH